MDSGSAFIDEETKKDDEGEDEMLLPDIDGDNPGPARINYRLALPEIEPALRSALVALHSAYSGFSKQKEQICVLG